MHQTGIGSMRRKLKTSLAQSAALVAVLLTSLIPGSTIVVAAAGKELRVGGRVWRLTIEGRVEGDGAPTGLPLLADAAVSPGASILYGLVPQPDGRTTDLIGLTIPEGQVMTRWPLPGGGRFLAVSRDGDHAVVLGLRPRAKGEGPENWSLTAVSLEDGRLRGPLSLGLVPHDILLLQTPLHDAADSRLYVAADDRIATFSISPPASSWFHKSPGWNRRLAGLDGSDVIVALRGGAVAIFDPAKRRRNEGRVILTDDDATAVIEVPDAASGLRLVEDGRKAAVLSQDGAVLTLVDVAGATIPETPRQDTPKPEATKPAAQNPLVLEPPAPKPDEPPPPPPVDPAPKIVPIPEPPKQPDPTPTHDSVPATEPPKADLPTPPSPPAPDSVSLGLNGRVTGEAVAGLHVLLYGPGNILKLRDRAIVGPEGRFHLLLPPPGAYRLVVSAPPGSGGQIFTTPDFRSVLVGDDTTIVEGLDFKLRGRL